MHCNLATLPRTVEITCTIPQHPRDVLGGQRHCAWQHAGADNGGRWLCRTDRVRAAGEPLMLWGQRLVAAGRQRPQPQIVTVVPSSFVLVGTEGQQQDEQDEEKLGPAGAPQQEHRVAQNVRHDASSRVRSSGSFGNASAGPVVTGPGSPVGYRLLPSLRRFGAVCSPAHRRAGRKKERPGGPGRPVRDDGHVRSGTSFRRTSSA